MPPPGTALDPALPQTHPGQATQPPEQGCPPPSKCDPSGPWSRCWAQCPMTSVARSCPVLPGPSRPCLAPVLPCLPADSLPLLYPVQPTTRPPQAQDELQGDRARPPSSPGTPRLSCRCEPTHRSTPCPDTALQPMHEPCRGWAERGPDVCHRAAHQHARVQACPGPALVHTEEPGGSSHPARHVPHQDWSRCAPGLGLFRALGAEALWCPEEPR